VLETDNDGAMKKASTVQQWTMLVWVGDPVCGERCAII
jgi:hypothetical protein